VVASSNGATQKWSRKWLERMGFDVLVAEDGATALATILESGPQVVLAEAGLESSYGNPLCAELRALREVADLPVVTICRTNREIREALDSGSTDVVRKPVEWLVVSRRIDTLARMYESSHELSRTRRCLRDAEHSAAEAERRLRLQDSQDLLTALPNRPRFESLIERALSMSRAGSQLAVMYMDLDRFKAINEIVGRAEGDQILRQVANRLQNCLRRSDLVARRRAGIGTAAVARLSGDEFTLLLTHVRGREEVLRAAQRLLQSLADPFAVGTKDIYLSGTLGVALSGGEADTADVLLQHAELAKCDAKRQGGGMVRLFEQSMEPLTERRVDLHRMLRAALEADELALHYQPLIDVASGRVVAAEALLRWQHKELGSISPGEFLPAVEGTDLMLALGAWVLRTACRQAMEWRRAGLPPIRMAVNVAASQLRRGDLSVVVRDVLAETGMAPALLELELSEKGVLHLEAETLRQLEDIKSQGVRLSVDDFGTGQSAIGYLRRFPLDVLKIDRSYVAGVARSESDAGLASAMVAMAHSLNLRVVAEGVEREQQMDLLREWGCDELQGFLFSPAVREEEFRQMLRSGSIAPKELNEKSLD
jgi:diguanylate cyclase (GGDEF)-like protein